MKRLCKTKDEVVTALPLVREALVVATGATLDCTAGSMTLTIQLDMKHIIRLLEESIAKTKVKSNDNDSTV